MQSTLTRESQEEEDGRPLEERLELSKRHPELGRGAPVGELRLLLALLHRDSPRLKCRLLSHKILIIELRGLGVTTSSLPTVLLRLQ